MSINDLFDLSIDERNKELWDTLELENHILIEESFEENYIINFNRGITTIYIDPKNPNPASFAHELLHLKIKNEGCNVGKILNNQIDKFNELAFISKPLKDHISNCMEHVKMINMFTGLGYLRRDFLDDYNIKKITFFETLNLKLRWTNPQLRNDQILGYYIGKYFAMVACPNLKFTYTWSLRTFKRLSPKLYDILDRFWNNWLNFRIEQPKSDYEKLTSDFVNELYKWRVNEKGYNMR